MNDLALDADAANPLDVNDARGCKWPEGNIRP